MTESRRLSLSSSHSQSSSQLKTHKSVNVSIDQSLSKSVNLTSFQDSKLSTKKIPLGGSRDNSMTRRSKMLTQSGTASQIKVIARFRPFNEKELRELPHKFQDIINIPEKQSKTCYVYSDLQQTQSYLSFTLDHIFTPETKQSEVFDFIGKGSIEDVLSGYNSTVFAYGQTGSGKTFTMMGSSIFNAEGKGLIPRISEHIFSYIQEKGENDIEFTVICSMVEIYQEKLYDLLDSNSDKMLIIKESPLKGIYIDQLAEISVVDEEEILEVIQMGEKLRTVSSTSMNKKSSRSHILFILEIRQKHSDDTEKIGKLNLIDLAGSEKVKKSKASGITLEEAKKINLSLSALGNVIHSLTSSADHIPYRDSKLTRLLQESLGGNYKTTLLIACSPHVNNIQETISTLQFAARAKTIKNCVKVNMKLSTAQLQQMIQELQKELLATKIELEKYKANFTETSQIYEVTNMTCFTETPPNISAFKATSPQMQQLPPSSSKQLEKRRKQLSDLVINLNESSLDSSLMESIKVETTKNSHQQTEESFGSKPATYKSVQLQTDEPIINKEEVATKSQQQIEVQLSPKPKIAQNFQQQTENLSSSKDQINKRRQHSSEKSLNNKYQTRYNQKKVQESHFSKSKSTQNLQQQAEKTEASKKEMKNVHQQTETS